ncbi:MAG: F0F1 ATP synthase subunit epsilon [Gammaproteobacteria bacterium]|nr:F0F1 ATP synthase subunit epsilon [Gammaproteobacteria bacterium]
MITNSKPIQLDIVSAEAELFSGSVAMVIVSGAMGELGIVHGHSPLLTKLKPGHIRIFQENNEQQLIYVSGGLLEVQPYTVTILSQVAVRGEDLDESAALAAKERAEQMLKSREKGDFDYSHATAELAQAVAQLKTIRDLRKKAKV